MTKNKTSLRYKYLTTTSKNKPDLNVAAAPSVTDSNFSKSLYRTANH